MNERRPSETTDSAWRPRSQTAASSAARKTERAVQILDEVLLRAALEGTRGFAAARVVLCCLFIARELVFRREALFAGAPREVLVVSLLGVGALVSAFFAIFMRQLPATTKNAWNTRMLASVVDAFGFFVIMSAMIAWPDDDYAGLWNEPWPHAVILIVIGAGLRLDKAFVFVAGLMNAVSLVVLTAIDFTWWPERVRYGADELAFSGILFASATIVGVMVAATAKNLALRGARRAIEAARAREKLGAYLGLAVAREALAADEIVMGGKRQNVAVIFSDLRGFTTTAETLAPEELVVQLNAYLEDMVAVIDEQGGVVDKYIGDGIMAVFGAPTSKPDDAQRALTAVRRMREALVKHNAARARRGQKPLEHGVGAHYGPAIAGNIGTREHAQYTIVGDVVNVAARLEGMTKEQGAPALVSRELVDAARACGAVDDVVPGGTLAVRGRQGTIEVFALAER